ncbi:MAG: Crp/Fnr family transcriptional regulator [Clostridia bacterium]|nr:Crp/Fnr family transcriptional regulator [Clostridia bacterium]
MKKIFDLKHFIEELNKNCALTEIRKFKKNEIITTYLLKRNQMCILLKGEAYLARYDKEGNRRIIYYFKENDIFGEAFYKIHTNRELFVVAKKDCEVLLLPYDIIENCNKDCTFHITLLKNLPDLILHRVSEINYRTELLANKSIKEKLLSYLYNLSIENNNKTFEIPISLSELADYLVIDRTAMMKQFRKLQDKKIILKKKNKITIIDKDILE